MEVWSQASIMRESDDEEEQPREADAMDEPLQDADPVECVPCDAGNIAFGPPCAGERIPKTLTSPVKPSAEAVALHYTTHLPYRNWCPVCVRAKAIEDAHKRGANEPDEEDEGGVPEVAIDYNALDEFLDVVEEANSKLKTLVLKDDPSGSMFQHKIDVKGAGDEWLMKRICKDLEELGRRDTILKSDGEPAIVAVQSKIQSMRSGRTFPKNPPAYNPEANGPIEKAVRDVTAHSRALKLGLESRLQKQLPDGAKIIEWILELAPFLLSKYSVGHDGMTSHERLLGTKWRRPCLEIGEVVFAKLVGRKRKKGKKDKQRKKLAEQAVEAVWVGQMARTGEHIVAQPNGGDAFRCRTVRRVPKEDRWNWDKIMSIEATPRKPSPNKLKSDVIGAKIADDEAQAPQRTRRHPARSAQPGDEAAALPMPSTREDDVRDFRITETLLAKYGGYMEGCLGCEHKKGGLPGHQKHSHECRLRLQKSMEKDEKGRGIVEAARMRKSGHGGEAAAAAPAASERPPAHEEPPQADAEMTSLDEDLFGTQKFGDEDLIGTPRFGEESEDDEPDDDEIMELNEQNFRKRKESKGSQDEDSEDNEEPRSKKQKLKLLITTESEHGTTIAKCTYTEKGDCDQLQPLFKHSTPTTLTARAMCEKNVDEKDARTSVERHFEEMKDCLKLLAAVREHTEVKKIIKDLDEAMKVRITAKTTAPLNNTGNCDVAEVYSPPRMTTAAEEVGLRPGWALDLTQRDENGEPWDFSKAAQRQRARQKQDDDKPFMLILCPMCGPFSSVQNLNYVNMSEAEVKEKLKDALEHVKFAVELCLRQHREGRLFMFEHPAGASSWESRLLRDLGSREGVHKVNFDFCEAGMEIDGTPVKKRTRIMTNSTALHMILRHAQCRGDHEHADTLDGKVSECQVYPRKFCMMVCQAIKREVDNAAWQDRMCEAFDISAGFDKLMKVQEKMDKMECPPEEDPYATLYSGLEFMDDISGAPLMKELAIEARKAEMQFFKKLGVYTKVPREKWMRAISTKWIDQNKGDEKCPNYRARLVGREIKRSQRLDLFAATPPLESLKLIISICASNQFHEDPAHRFVVMANDVKRAYFYAPATRPVYITIPDEDYEEGDEHRVGRLNLSLYGTRDAAMNWAAKYTEVLRGLGFQVGSASPCNFFHGGRQISVTVHGDDFTSTGTAHDLEWLDMKFKEEFEIKTEVLGPRHDQKKQIRVLNRVIAWGEDGITYEADQRHAELIIGELGLDNAKAVATPGSREDASKAGPPTSTTTTTNVLQHDHEANAFMETAEIYEDERLLDATILRTETEGLTVQKLLDANDAKLFRGIAARLNYLAQDRPDLQFAAKEVSRRMARPTDGDWLLLKRVGRYLLGAPRAVQTFAWQYAPYSLDTYVDSDWAGCKASCRSTSGGAVKLGRHALRTWSSTQATVVQHD